MPYLLLSTSATSMFIADRKIQLPRLFCNNQLFPQMKSDGLTLNFLVYLIRANENEEIWGSIYTGLSLFINPLQTYEGRSSHPLDFFLCRPSPLIKLGLDGDLFLFPPSHDLCLRSNRMTFVVLVSEISEMYLFKILYQN